MALKGLDIFKLSPKKNCKECGCPTCMAFCMKVAQGALPLDQVPLFRSRRRGKAVRGHCTSHEDPGGGHRAPTPTSWVAKLSCSGTKRLWFPKTCSP